METITSRTNPLCTHLRKLEEALAYGGSLQTVVCTEQAALPFVPAGVRLVAVPGDVMKSISPAQTPQGVLCVCKMPESALPERLTGRRYVVLDGVQDPGNVGTILRTADAFGADGVFLVNGCADLYNPKTVRATMGAIFRCPAWSCGLEEVLELLVGIPLYGAALRSDTTDVRTVKYWLWLAELRGLNNQTRLALLRHFGTPEDVFYADTGELLLTEGITREQALALETVISPPQTRSWRTARG